MRRLLCLCLLLAACPVRADEPKKDDLAAKLKELADKPILPKDFDAPNMLVRDVRARLKEANQRDIEAWVKIKTKADWEKFRDEKIAALKKSLGEFPEPPKDMKVRITKTIEGDGYAIENTLFESRPGLWVTANIYRPAKPGKSMPGILIIHSHHNPKEQGELQDMGVTWAKAGCYVLVMDQLGHGERRQHPFVDAKSYPEPFRVGRQDYWFRYNLGMQLSLIGESLIGWMAWDLMRGVDVLLAKPGIDKDKIALLGSVAGGGDPAGVTAALDPRIKCVVPFNFGGPQPETRYPLPDDAEKTFNYAGGGSWESTRNLRNSARDGFLPWVIVASVAPRYLIHAHEFAWDKERDPVWKRYRKVWGFDYATDKLAFAHGVGGLVTKDPPGSHCNNIGAVHRKQIHAAFEKWFAIKAVETKDRRTAEELRCWRGEEPHSHVIDLALRMALKQNDSIARFDRLGFEKFRADLSNKWKRVLGVDPQAKALEVSETLGVEIGNCAIIQLNLHVERAIHVPAVLMLPKRGKGDPKTPCVLAIAAEGKARFLRDRTDTVARLLDKGIAVCLADVRGTGETRLGQSRGRSSGTTSISSSEQMLGGSLLGQQLRDLSAVLEYLKKRADLDPTRIALWGENFAAANTADRRLEVPHDAEKYPQIGEPGAGLLATFGGYFHADVRCILIRGGLVSSRSLLTSPYVYIPHDSFVPDAFSAGDIEIVLSQVAPKNTRLEGMIDAQNRRLGAKALDKELVLANLMRPCMTPLEVSDVYSNGAEIAAWLTKKLR